MSYCGFGMSGWVEDIKAEARGKWEGAFRRVMSVWVSGWVGGWVGGWVNLPQWNER